MPHTRPSRRARAERYLGRLSEGCSRGSLNALLQASPLGVALLCGWLSGCSSSQLGVVHGAVTYDGQPLEHGRILFLPDEGRSAFGDIDRGKYTLTTYKPGDGALIGTHHIIVQSDVLSDPHDAFSDRTPLIPERYGKAETSGLTAEVKPGRNQLDFDLVD